MPLIKRFRVVPVAAVLLITICSPLSAQTVRGTVVDSATSSPVSAASVELVGPDSQLVAEETSDNRGRFRLRAKGAGAYRIRVQRIGYRAFESVLDARGDTSLVLRLVAVPLELDPVGVIAEAHPYLRSQGFYERLQAGSGTFLTPAEVDRRAPKAKFAVDIMQGIPGVRLQVPSGSGGVRIPYLRSCRSDPRRRVMTMTGLIDTTELANVYPHIYLDGVGSGPDVFGWLLPAHILAIEIYMGPAQIPLQYGGTGAPCGVILIWTKR